MAECRDSTINNTNTPKQSIVIGHNDSNEENKTDKVMEPLLIEDIKNGSLPRSFQKICAYMNENGVLLDTNDYIFLLIHVLMLECGFVTPDSKEYLMTLNSGFHLTKILDCVEKIAPNWKKNETVHSGIYILPPYVNCPCKVSCTECADDIIVNGVIHESDYDHFCLLLDPSRYVISSTVKMENKFQDIAHLSLIFKSSIGIPIKNAVRACYNIPGLGIEDLPTEILFYITQYLDVHSLEMLKKTCRSLSVIVKDRMLWRKKNRGCEYRGIPKAQLKLLRIGLMNRFRVNRRLD